MRSLARAGQNKSLVFGAKPGATLTPKLTGKTRPRGFRSGRTPRNNRIVNMDAAQVFDFEGKMMDKMRKAQHLHIGIVGFGTFGQFLAKRFMEQGHHVTATSRTSYAEQAAEIGVTFFEDANDFCECHPDVVVFCTSILSLEKVLESFPTQRLRRSTLIVDVASVKAYPRHAMLRLLPAELDILCTHPMFGPDSGSGSWKNLKFMYEEVRVGEEKSRKNRVQIFLNCFESEGCEMVCMPCDQHDQLAASSQFITHTVGRILGEMNLERTSIDTKGYESLMSLVENTTHDSFDLFYGLFLYNPNAPEELAKLERALDGVKMRLFDRLHSKVREQLFPGSGAEAAPSSRPVMYQIPEKSSSEMHVSSEIKPIRPPAQDHDMLGDSQSVQSSNSKQGDSQHIVTDVNDMSHAGGE